MVELFLTFGLLAMLGFSLFFLVLFVIPSWLIFKKAGRHGWEAIIPIYNAYVMTEIAGLPWWVFLGLFIPVVQLAVFLVIAYYLSQRFGHGMGYALGITFLPFFFLPILGYGDSVYSADVKNEENNTNTSETAKESDVSNNANMQMSTNVSEIQTEVKTEVKPENTETVQPASPEGGVK